MISFSLLIPVVLLISVAVTSGNSQESPVLSDSRLELKLFAETPDIVTPIGMVSDQRNRIYVIESHTHHPPADYDGPAGDRIKVFVDRNDDGEADEITVFADGLHQAMNLALSPDGELYVVCAREVLRLVDEDHDGICDRQQKVLELVTPERYAHNSLLGITFDRDEWMYISRGNVGSHHYRFQGRDDTSVEGYGDGGNVVRCRADGTEIEELATGFWNPFDLKFDRHGRLLLVDNDPDARGPNRLVHVVEGGDYGYKSLYGGSGNHPFQGWDGTLPGTLPYIVGTGEAPSGLVDCRRSSLPGDYANSVLVTIWNENSIERFDLRPSGSSLACVKKSVFLKGSKDFRPVAIDCDRRGNIFVTDWVLVDYPNHGRGRIWRISTNGTSDRLRPQDYFAEYSRDVTAVRQNELLNSPDEDTLVEALSDGDAFLRHAAQRCLASDPRFDPLRIRLTDHDNARVRLGALLATKRSHADAGNLIREFLLDNDTRVRQAALMWAGESLNGGLRPYLRSALKIRPVTASVFETYLAALQNLENDFIDDFDSRQSKRAKDIPRRLNSEILVQIAKDNDFSNELRALAIGKFEDQAVTTNADWLLRQLTTGDEVLARSVIRRIAESPNHVEGFPNVLAAVALTERRSPTVRCEALLELGPITLANLDRFLPLLRHSNEDIAIEAARTFRAWLDAGRADECVAEIGRMHLSREVRTMLAYAQQGRLFPGEAAELRPTDNAEWRVALESGGKAERGRRVFYSSRVGCSKCHTVDGRSGFLGPDLSGAAQSKSRSQIVDAILDPSAEFPPQYQAWVVVTADGLTHPGLQLDHQSGGAIVLLSETGKQRRFEAEDIEEYAALPSSLMPSGLSETMTVSEFRDLVAFLESFVGQPQLERAK